MIDFFMEDFMKREILKLCVVLTITAVSLSACSIYVPREREVIDTTLSNETSDITSGAETNDPAGTVSKESEKSKSEESDTISSETENSALIEQFNEITSKDPVDLSEAAVFLKDNSNALSENDITTALLRYEELQSVEIKNLEKKYFNDEIQKSFTKASSDKLDINKPELLKDAKIKALVEETELKGFKVEQGEGMYYPVIDYSFYKSFTDNASPDIKAYFDIMAVESDKVYAKDAALAIGWDEVIKRTLSQEEFLNTYPDSPKASDIMALYKTYEFITMYGTNNTPLFDYETQIMNEDAKSAYLKAVLDNAESNYLKELKGFMDALQLSNYKLTKAVDTYRKNATSN